MCMICNPSVQNPIAMYGVMSQGMLREKPLLVSVYRRFDELLSAAAAAATNASAQPTVGARETTVSPKRS